MAESIKDVLKRAKRPMGSKKAAKRSDSKEEMAEDGASFWKSKSKK